MKQEVFEYKSIEYIFFIGKNKEENFKIIDESVETDIWFHVNDEPSCHVILKNTDKLRDIPKQVIKKGAYLCKINSKAKTKLATIMYTPLMHVTKTDVIGQVIVETFKTLSL
jgi:predicted ribosome quality control (RQC) complex YloA/Tae2 family protein